MGSRRTPLSKFLHYLPFGCFVTAVLCLCFAYGLAVGKWHVFPHNFLNAGWDSLEAFRNRSELPHFIHSARYPGEGVVVCEREQVHPGVTLVTGVWKNGNDWDVGIHLVDLNGKVLHKWQCNPRSIWPNSPHNDRRAGSFDDKTKTFVHGALLLPGGDVIFNLEYFGLVRLDSQSKIIWKVPYRTHHSIFQDEDGKLWICNAKWREKSVEKFLGLRPPFVDDMILKVSLNGEIEREISILDIIYESEYYSLLFTTGQTTGDILHLNDIEVLSEKNAVTFDLFQAGDIMVSLRDINTVFVIDGKTERIKWSMISPFIAQHDPDFTGDGYITIFDNHLDNFGGSRILRIEPSTRRVEVQYGHKEGQYFFTLRCGKHQHLPNGNMLVTEAQAGRIFEINVDGKVVWSWLAPRWDESHVPEILEGTRYDAEYANFTNGLRKNEE